MKILSNIHSLIHSNKFSLNQFQKFLISCTLVLISFTNEVSLTKSNFIQQSFRLHWHVSRYTSHAALHCIQKIFPVSIRVRPILFLTKLHPLSRSLINYVSEQRRWTRTFRIFLILLLAINGYLGKKVGSKIKPSEAPYN